jgi:hypothetical protein
MIKTSALQGAAARQGIRPITPIHFATDLKSAQFKGHFTGSYRNGQVGDFLAREGEQGELSIEGLT